MKRTKKRLILASITVFALCVLSGDLLGQTQAIVGRGSYPIDRYYNSFPALRQGDFRLAREAFQETARSGLRTIDGPWVDAVCYRVMLGESYLRLGRRQLAIDQYNAALNLLIKRREWITRVEFPANVQASSRRISPPVTWGAGTRTARYAAVPNRFQIVLGNLNNAQTLQQGGVIVGREIHSINVHEIIRCTCLALRRRYELLGPICKHDPLTAQVVAALDARVGVANHWSQAWVNVQRGWALACAGKTDEAVNNFKAAVVLQGQFDHPLTATALMGLGTLARDNGQPAEALKFFISASVAAAVFEEIETVEDALTAASDVHLAGVPQQSLPQLPPALTWATRKRLPHLAATISVLGAENQTSLRKPVQAGKLLANARKSTGRRAQLAAGLAARAEFVSAQMQYQQGRLAGARAAFQSAIQQQRTISPWISQVATVSKLYRGRSGAITPRAIGELFAELLKDPTASDWSFRPLDSLAFVLTPNRAAHEDWFNLALDRDEARQAMEVGEILRRRRFYSKLPLGGRVLSLRWILEAPEEILPEEARATRLDLLARYPTYKALSDKSRELMDKLRELPVDVDEEQAKEQKDAADELQEISEKQEAILGELALRREASPFVFPPQMSHKELQESLKPKQLALIYVATSTELHGFMMSRNDYFHWELPKFATMRRDLGSLLKLWGLTSESAPVPVDRLRDTEWKADGEKLLRSVIDRGQHGFWNNFDELVIVPDGLTWYVPFEALPIDAEKKQPVSDAENLGDADEEDADKADAEKKDADAEAEEVKWDPLVSRIRIRYAPTAGLINAKRLPPARDAKNVFALGRLFPREDQERTREQYEEIEQVAENVVALPSKLQAPSGLLRVTWGGLVVLDDIAARDGPLDFSPARVDSGKPGSKLSRWLELPWGGPAQIMMPGFHTAAEDGLKSKKDGDELFTATMAMMATGARSIVLSRWRTGGATSYDLVREYLQEAEEAEPSEAWQRSLNVVRASEIDREREPRVSPGRDKDPLPADHPFFWAGYLFLGSE